MQHAQKFNDCNEVPTDRRVSVAPSIPTWGVYFPIN
jgi:hypothetical protein